MNLYPRLLKNKYPEYWHEVIKTANEWQFGRIKQRTDNAFKIEKWKVFFETEEINCSIAWFTRTTITANQTSTVHHTVYTKILSSLDYYIDVIWSIFKSIGLGAVAHACIPALWEAKVGRSPEVRSSRPAWPTWLNPVSTENTKIRQPWWRAPVTPATWEAEAGELLGPRRQRLWWAEITPLHSSLGDESETLSQ